MAKEKAQPSAEQANLGPARVKKLLVKNFRCIGQTPVEVDLDDIVVLVGPNNVGKSTILRAYEVVMNHGSNEGRLSIADFPNEVVDGANLPEIELQTYIDPETKDKPGEQWLHTEAETGRTYVRERWIWDSPNKDPKRQGRRAKAEDWSEDVPWGAPNVAKSHRPIPHRVDAFASPEAQAQSVVDIIKSVLLEQAKRPGEGEDAVSALEKLKTEILRVQAKLIENSQAEISKIEEQLSSIISEVFKGFKVKIDPRHEDLSDKALSLFNTEPILRMGPEGGHSAPIEKQGSGARRTLLWSALKLVGERTGDLKKTTGRQKAKAASEAVESVGQETQRPHVLLMDEPEICLHPNAIREACRVLYGLAAEGSGWQVMVTTHSPAFIDLSRDNTTIVRVELDAQGTIRGTTVFRPAVAQLDDDDRTQLKLLNVWDPYVGEFFFGGRPIIVEGDTEYSAFRQIIEKEHEQFGDVHVIRARGKFIIPSLMKILNHFGAGYAVLHDSDTPTLKNGNKNPAWEANRSILKIANASPNGSQIRVAACIRNFDEAFLGITPGGEKPFIAVAKMATDEKTYARVRDLLRSLLDSTKPVPTGVHYWATMEELETAATT